MHKSLLNETTERKLTAFCDDRLADSYQFNPEFIILNSGFTAFSSKQKAQLLRVLLSLNGAIYLIVTEILSSLKTAAVRNFTWSVTPRRGFRLRVK